MGIGSRPTWAEVDLGAIDFNFRQVRKIIGKGKRIMAVVKCDAYGHGLLAIAKRMSSLGADYLGVASIDEAVILREKKIRLPILVLGNILSKDAGLVIKYRLAQAISDYRLALELNQQAKGAKRRAIVHIKVDTGMGRLGVAYQQAFGLIKRLSRLKNLRIEGLFTHFPSADSDAGFTRYQIEIFSQLVRKLKEKRINIPLLHTANSMGIVGYRHSHFNLVRPGLMLYGIPPRAGINLQLKPALSLKTRVIFLKRMPPGQGISYGRNYITKKETTIAVMPIGYGDGYPRCLSDRADVLIKGRRFRICGTICMDYLMVDVGDFPLRVGQEAVLIGREKQNSVSAAELAKLSGTIAYEILCGIGSRVPRIYI